MLRIKPVMMIHQGVISVAGKIRTRKRAIEHALKICGRTMAPFERLAMIHVNAPEAAEKLRQQAAHLFPTGIALLMMEITPAIGHSFRIGRSGVCLHY